MTFALNQLRRAILERDEELIRGLLDQGTNVNQRVGGMTPLNHAVYSASLPIIRLLLKYGASVNQSSVCGDAEEGEEEYPIISAARGRNKLLVETLIENGASVNVVDSAHFTPLYYGSMAGNTSIVKVLLKHKAWANQPVGNLNSTALYTAVIYGHIDVVKLLHQFGADLNYCDSINSIALHNARDSAIDAAVFLLQRGTLLDVVNKAGHTPFRSAVVRREPKVAKLCVRHGADVNLGGPVGEDAAMLAAGNSNWEFVEFLVHAGLDLNEAYRSISATNLQRLLDSNATLMQWLLSRLTTPLSLKECSRHAVRNYVKCATGGRSILGAVDALPLPRILRLYLVFERL